MAVADRLGLPIAVCIESTTRHEVKLATSTLVEMIVPKAPQNLIGGKIYQRGQPRPDKEDTVGCDIDAYEKQSDQHN